MKTTIHSFEINPYGTVKFNIIDEDGKITIEANGECNVNAVGFIRHLFFLALREARNAVLTAEQDNKTDEYNQRLEKELENAWDTLINCENKLSDTK